MDLLFHAYDIFISNFPKAYQGLISVGILAVIVIGLYHLIRKSLLWLVLLLIFVPASIPIISRIGTGLLEFLKYILSKA